MWVITSRVSFPIHATKLKKKIVFADGPHLLKLLRNHLIDNGFNIDGDKIDTACIESLLKCSISELIFAHKLTRYHLDVKGPQRQKVKLVAPIFSNSVSRVLWKTRVSSYTF
jgi:hypothetical protein